VLKSETVRFTLRIVPTLNELLEQESKELGMPKNTLIAQILRQYFKSKKSRRGD
jgi:ribbon-helix-helix protein, copG family